MTEKGKQFRINQIVAVCVKKGKTPHSLGFADFIFRLCATYFSVDKRTIKAYIDTLIQSFHYDHWKTIVASNGFLTAEEKQGWINSLS